MTPVQLSICEETGVSVEAAFAAATSIDPRALIKKHLILPGVVDVKGHDAPWSAIGQNRRLTLSDGSTASEELVGFTPDQTFAYRVSEFTGAFAPLVAHARGEWHFTSISASRCRIDWTYIFFPKGPVEEALVWFIVKLFWPGYLKGALTRVKDKAEGR